MHAATVPIINALDDFFEKHRLIRDGEIKIDVSSCEMANSRRIFHGRGGCFTGLEWCCVDFFSSVFLITCFKEPPDQFIEDISAEIMSRSTSFCVLKQSRYLAKSPIEVVRGKIPENVSAKRGKLEFILNFDQQNVGYFLDMEPGRKWLEEKSEDKKVLNLFSYTCVFSVIAKEAGAREIINIDMSKRGLSVGRENHRKNNHDLTGIQFLGLDILKSWSRIRKNGPYDIIIIDPPSYQKGSFIASRDYVKIIRRIKEFSTPTTEILMCLNDPKTPPQFLKDLVALEAPCLRYVSRLPAHPDFPDISEDASLKLLTYRIHDSCDDAN